MSVRERTLAARLERFRRGTADLRPALMLGAIGIGQHVIREEGSNLERIVPSMQGRETYRPGAKVTIATHAGKSGPAIIGKAPAGQQGGSGFALRRYPPGPAPTEESNLRYIALYNDPAFNSVMSSAFYNGAGEWLEDRGTLELLGPSESLSARDAMLIRTDPLGAVGDGSFLFYDFAGPVVWDVLGEASYQALEADPLYPAWPGDGYAYWATFASDAAGYAFTFKRAGANLSSPETLGSVTVLEADWPVPHDATSGDPISLAAPTLYFSHPARWDEAAYFGRARLEFAGAGGGAGILYQAITVRFPWSGSGGSVIEGGWSRIPGGGGDPDESPPIQNILPSVGFWWSQCAGPSAGSDASYIGEAQDFELDGVQPDSPLPVLSRIEADGTISPLWDSLQTPYTADGAPQSYVDSVSVAADGASLAVLETSIPASGVSPPEDYVQTVHLGTPGGETAAVVFERRPADSLPVGAVFIE
jgi:hypothetical protein